MELPNRRDVSDGQVMTVRCTGTDGAAGAVLGCCCCVPDSHASVTLDSAVSLAPCPSPPSSLQWAWKSPAEMWVPGSTRGDPRVLLCGPEWVCHSNYIIYVWFIIRCWSFIANISLLHLVLFSINFTHGWKKIFFNFSSHDRFRIWNIELRKKPKKTRKYVEKYAQLLPCLSLQVTMK